MSRYLGESDYAHGAEPCTGILLTNLGTPDAPTPAALRRYLAEFLWDPRVVETPRLIWWLVLHGVILRIRPRRSARLYAKVWEADGSPLLEISRRQAAALQRALQAKLTGRVEVALAMRYGQPSIAYGLDLLRRHGARRVLVFPLYPQYAAATTASTFDAVADVLRRWRWLPELRMIAHYHDDPGYIAALAASVRSYWQQHGASERLLFSFHGIPKRYFLAGDPYHCECQKTARLVAEQLEAAKDRWSLAFQSRFGPQEWLTPYTDHTLREWARGGVRSVDVVCPGFSADCLETLEEIGQQNREVFLTAGGEDYRYIPALNDSPEHIEALADIVARHCAGWPATDPARDPERQATELKASAERARAMGSPR